MQSPDRQAPENDDHRYRALLDALSHGVQENDCAGVITYSNRAHHRILGYEYGELLGKAIWEVLETESEEVSLKRYLASLVQEQPPPVPYMARNRKKDGSLVDLQVDWNYLRDAGGRLKGFVSVITDVTEIGLMEKALRDRTKGLSTLLEVSSSFVASLDLQKILQASVDGVAKLVGLNTAAVYLLEGDVLKLWATVPPLPVNFPDELREAPIADHIHLSKAITSRAPVFLEDMLYADLTPAERSVREQRDLRTVLFLPLVADDEAMGALIVGSNGQPTLIPESERVLSLTLANLAAMAVRNARLFADRQSYAARLEQTLTERIAAEKDRAALQERLLQGQKIEAVGRLAGGVAHDFNNMLSVILGHAELSLGRADLPEEITSDLREIRRAAERSADLTRQLLGFARRQTAAPRILDLNETVAGMLKMLRRLISEGIDLDWLPGRNLWPVKVDPVQVDQILVNLCVNASDAMLGAGKVIIETRNIAISQMSWDDRPGCTPGDYVELSVSDNGRGMDKETRDRVFEPFFTTKNIGSGTGLGLATVYGIVKQNGGFINVYSEVEGGTVFKVYLPGQGKETRVERVDRSESPVVGGEETVLLVEDEPSLLELGRRMLEMLGYTVIAAATPSEAVRSAEKHGGTIHLLLTDVVLPGMNGRELAAKVRGVLDGRGAG